MTSMEHRELQRLADCPADIKFHRDWLSQALYGEVPKVALVRDDYVTFELEDGVAWYLLDSEWANDGSRKDDALWVVYSSNKEDIWVSRIPVPIRAGEDNVQLAFGLALRVGR